MKKNKILRNQKGFTLIEVIAVLIILGILAAVAVPRYFDMQREVEMKTLEVALNDMKSRAILAYSKSLLANNGVVVVADINDFSDLGLSALADVTAAYTDFPGTWAYTSNVLIQYTIANGGGTGNFDLTIGGPGPPPFPPTVALTTP